MITNSNVSRNTKINFIKYMVNLEKYMRNIHNLWESSPTFEEELEESPWMDYPTIFFSHIEDDFVQAVDCANSIISIRQGFGKEHEAAYLMNIELYFKGVGAGMLNLINTGSSCSDNDFVLYKVQTDMCYRYICVSINNICELDNDELDEEFNIALNELNMNAREYSNFINSMSDKLPISSNRYVIENYDFIIEQIKNNDVDKDVFIQFSSSIMFYDIVAMKSGKLILDNEYVKRLETRIESPFSLYNCCPEVYDIADLITPDLAYDFYLNEFSINEADIDSIKQGKATVSDILRFIKEQNGETNFFG